jgi:hypothetical protein
VLSYTQFVARYVYPNDHFGKKTEKKTTMTTPTTTMTTQTMTTPTPTAPLKTTTTSTSTEAVAAFDDNAQFGGSKDVATTPTTTTMPTPTVTTVTSAGAGVERVAAADNNTQFGGSKDVRALREALIARFTHEGHPGRRFLPLFDELKEVRSNAMQCVFFVCFVFVLCTLREA